jgi:predicted DNA-binding protein (MmcQ/YjbR family)
MDIDSIREYCLSFPNSKENLQWGDNLCFKVGGKIFVILGLDELRVCFKTAPDVFAELVEREDIRPAPYVGRYKWVMLDRLDAVVTTSSGAGAAVLRMVSTRCPKSAGVPHVSAQMRRKPAARAFEFWAGTSPRLRAVQHLAARGAIEHLRLHRGGRNEIRLRSRNQSGRPGSSCLSNPITRPDA